ncbi:MAG TPA: hypothetical protein VLJ68_01495 [Chitinophagaceae bacterium]|nr:hypothetical protein [Chitinophagaceae bacterium]
MAEGGVNRFERILCLAVGLGLAKADVGQLALDEIDQPVIAWLVGTLPAIGEGSECRVLAFEMAQDVLQPVLDPAEIAGVPLKNQLQKEWGS